MYEIHFYLLIQSLEFPYYFIYYFLAILFVGNWKKVQCTIRDLYSSIHYFQKLIDKQFSRFSIYPSIYAWQRTAQRVGNYVIANGFQILKISYIFQPVSVWLLENNNYKLLKRYYLKAQIGRDFVIALTVNPLKTTDVTV